VKAKQGSKVKIHYVGYLDDGTQVASTRDRNPHVFTIGKGQALPGLEKAVIGLGANQSKKHRVCAKDAFGDQSAELIFSLPRMAFPKDLQPRVGQRIQLDHRGADPISATVVGVEGNTVTLDANHPLAGKDVTFDITVVEVT
jgi:FKBP-type peptidyl-prolyl cis-trans isomerase 2